MSGWKEFQLGELYNVSSGLSKAADQFGFGNTFISFKDVFNNYFLPENPEGLVNSNEKEQISCSVKAGDILLTRTSETNDEVGMSSVALKDYEKSTFNGFCKRLRIKKDAPIKVSSLYIGYLLRTRFFRKTVANFATMTTRASLNSESIKGIPLLFPSFSLQEEIGKTLHCLDKKINLLKQQNQTMEELAQTLFKRWFVEFEFPNGNGKPYKSSGGKMVESELGEIPEGWKVGHLNDEFTILMGQSPSGSSFNESKVGKVFYQGRTDFGFRFPTNRLYTMKPKRIAYKFDVLVSVRAPVGDVNMASEECCIGRGLGAVKSDLKSYCFNKIKSLKKAFDVFEKEGTVFGSLSKNDFNGLEVIVPKKQVAEEYDKSALGLDLKIFENEQQIQTLTQLRGTLLPKLMNGELRIIMEKKQDASERARVF